MTNHLQTISDGVDGNCLQAAVASMLGLRLEQVPNFTLFRTWWFDALTIWCRENGYELLLTHNNSTTYASDELLLAFGMSPRGLRHAVVLRGETMLHDPHPDGTGLTDIDEVWRIKEVAA